jgi:[calcium/calmodulin-dependent protein kinase] kinase
MKAVKKFKGLIDDHKRPAGMTSTLSQGIRTLHHSSTGSLSTVDGIADPPLHKSKSTDLHDRRAVEQALAAEGVHHDINPPDANALRSMGSRVDSSTAMTDSHEQDVPHPLPKRFSSDDAHTPTVGVSRVDSHEKGHAHDPLDEEPLFLGIGSGAADMLEPPPQEVVAESPTAADFSIYDTAYQQEVDRIRAAQGHSATVYLTRRVDNKKDYKADANMINAPSAAQVEGSQPHRGFKDLLDHARAKDDKPTAKDKIIATGGSFSDIASKALANSRVMGKDLSDKGGVALDNILEKAMEKRKEMSQDKK